MLVRIKSAVLVGIDAIGVDVEVNIFNRGFPTFEIVGLASREIRESKDRIRTAILNSGLEFPDKKIIVNLAPADIPKEGALFDFPIALGILAANEGLSIPDDCMFFGELSLEGHVKKINGSIIFAIKAFESGLSNIFVPDDNANEATKIGEINVFPVKSIIQVYRHLKGESVLTPHTPLTEVSIATDVLPSDKAGIDIYNSIYGNARAKRALCIAAAGGHNILLIGCPGVGKTMLATCLKALLPDPTARECIEIMKIASATGSHKLMSNNNIQRPFRNPHHNISYTGMLGGGTIPRPGEITLAHRGVLFMDEFTQFSRQIIESLRQPLEDGHIIISRSKGSITFPSRFLLIAACNPCPCGYFGHQKIKCRCSECQISVYRKKLSGPILDRIDMHVEVDSINPLDDRKKLSHEYKDEVKELRKSILNAYTLQQTRLKSSCAYSNAYMSNREVDTFCTLTPETEILLKNAMAKFSLSMRAYYKLLKISRTIADLENSQSILKKHVAEALQYRTA